MRRSAGPPHETTSRSMRCNPTGPDAGRSDGWSYCETIDEANSAIRARGRLDRLAVDLLCGTIEQLWRRGHTDIAVTIELLGTADPCARPALTAMAERLASRHGRLSVGWVDGTDLTAVPVTVDTGRPGSAPTPVRRRVPAPHSHDRRTCPRRHARRSGAGEAGAGPRTTVARRQRG
jgi:hypothetical protein